eukprot:scaffold607168_cov19-Prasinocladus_malaysianus.AAC.1
MASEWAVSIVSTWHGAEHWMLYSFANWAKYLRNELLPFVRKSCDDKPSDIVHLRDWKMQKTHIPG